MSQNNNTDKTNVRILEAPSYIFYKAYFSWKRMTDKALEPTGLTHTQYVFLCVLQSLESKRQRPTQNDLARLTDSDVTMTSHVLRTLQKRGLIERKQLNGDERAKYPKLLPAGKQLIKEAEIIMTEFENNYFTTIDKNFEEFLQCLKDLTASREAYR